MKNSVIFWLAISAILSANSGIAQEEEQKKNRRGGAPSVAFEACAEASEGDSCSFTGRRGTDLTGSCAIYGEHGLVCYPDVEVPDATDDEQPQ